MTHKPLFLLFEACDFVGFPAGGQLTMARHIMAAFPGEIALVGVDTNKSSTVGVWHTRRIDGVDYPFFAIRRRNPTAVRPLIPVRIATYAAIRRHRRAILSLGVKRAFCQGHETLLAVANWPWESLCYDFPGVANPLGISRYPWARPLASLFDHAFFRSLRQADVVLATADHAAIHEMCRRSAGTLSSHQVRAWPTRVDTSVFIPADMQAARTSLGIPLDETVLVTTGRLNWVKGWPLLLDVIATAPPGWKIVFVGDGEDRAKLESTARTMNISNRVSVTGFKRPVEVAQYIQAADVFTLASHHEGFSTSMLEALACGKPIVSTAVSSADTIIKQGVNGFIVAQRCSQSFLAATIAALSLQQEAVREHNVTQLKQYAVNTIRRDLHSNWLGLQTVSHLP